MSVDCCHDRRTHGGPGCIWPGTKTEKVAVPDRRTLQAQASMPLRIRAAVVDAHPDLSDEDVDKTMVELLSCAHEIIARRRLVADMKRKREAESDGK